MRRGGGTGGNSSVGATPEPVEAEDEEDAVRVCGGPDLEGTQSNDPTLRDPTQWNPPPMVPP